MSRSEFQRSNLNTEENEFDGQQYSNKGYSRGYGDHGEDGNNDDSMSPHDHNKSSEIDRDPLQRLQQYIEKEAIQLEYFWDSRQTTVSADKFFEFCKKKALKFDDKEKAILTRELCDEHGEISYQQLCQFVPFWKDDEGILTEFIKQKTQEQAENSKKQFRKQQFNIRPASSLTALNKRPVSSLTQNNLRIAKELEKIEVPVDKPQPTNKSKYYLQKHKEREKEIDRLLKLTISKGRNEYEYEMLIKMGEANELSQMLNSKVTYRAYRSAQGDLKVHIYELDKYKTSMTLEEFQREYNALKNKYNETRNLRIWEVLSENKKSKPKEFNKQQQEEAQNADNQRGKINIQARHNELKGVLLKTMELTIVLKEQLAVINGVINNKKKKRPQSTNNQRQNNSTLKNSDNNM